jgi:hypothetical protein
MAKSGHSSSHCMHLMQSWGRGTVTRKTSISRTFFGQNSTQMLHPLQLRSITSILALLIPVGLLFLGWLKFISGVKNAVKTTKR